MCPYKVDYRKLFIEDKKFFEIIKQKNDKENWNQVVKRINEEKLKSMNVPLSQVSTQGTLRKKPSFVYVFWTLPLRDSSVVSLMQIKHITRFRESPMLLFITGIFNTLYFRLPDQNANYGMMTKINTFSRIILTLFYENFDAFKVWKNTVKRFFVRPTTHIVIIIPETIMFVPYIMRLLDLLAKSSNKDSMILIIFLSYDTDKEIKTLQSLITEKVNKYRKTQRERFSFVELDFITNVELKYLIDFLNERDLHIQLKE